MHIKIRNNSVIKVTLHTLTPHKGCRYLAFKFQAPSNKFLIPF